MAAIFALFGGKMTSHEASNQKEIDVLIDELMKDQPDDKLVRQLMIKLQIPYASDRIQQMNNVLLKLHPVVDDEKSSEL